MPLERVLELDLETTIEAFSRFRWKYFNVLDDEKRVQVEVPKNDSESLIVELPYEDETEQKQIVKKLKSEGFFKQTTRHVPR